MGIRELLAEPISSKIPKGWKRTWEYAKELGLSESQTSRILREGVREGTVLRKMFRSKTGSLIRPVPYYFIKG